MAATEHEREILATVSRVLSKLLRHEPECIGLKLDANGWADVQDLLAKLNRAKRSASAPKRIRTLPDIALDLDLLKHVVATNDKQRFAFSPDDKRIRAVQGHSTDVSLDYPAVEPPEVLFHGTAAETWPAISREGLVRGTRHAVHLSADTATAKRVGARHGRPVVLSVQAGQMHHDGYRFFCADNGVWLVAAVPARYISLVPRS